jgi:hypothetical protein
LKTVRARIGRKFNDGAINSFFFRHDQNFITGLGNTLVKAEVEITGGRDVRNIY